jgi:hypothetical protein
MVELTLKKYTFSVIPQIPNVSEDTAWYGMVVVWNPRQGYKKFNTQSWTIQ